MYTRVCVVCVSAVLCVVLCVCGACVEHACVWLRVDFYMCVYCVVSVDLSECMCV